MLCLGFGLCCQRVVVGFSYTLPYAGHYWSEDSSVVCPLSWGEAELADSELLYGVVCIVDSCKTDDREPQLSHRSAFRFIVC